jgi:hypothetical protein
VPFIFLGRFFGSLSLKVGFSGRVWQDGCDAIHDTVRSVVSGRWADSYQLSDADGGGNAQERGQTNGRRW